MAAKFTVFTPEAIDRIRKMKAKGARPAAIAKAIGTTQNSLKARCSQLGLNNSSKQADIAA
jgi:hypothetical protein